ncbi:hypothetical protein [Aliikangiella coralliicola]|uniref:Uncharacterized protein n=1 Tax=Aliikangiella coralliicola TaxID=2592383 RepID=A0A545U0Q1_9GAMM|nr:hypothetical protein [Aliikangiella coralliicola]TQV82983.1 hypothetical protein FLL46_24750 [Aliikangiella coralliicola]
MNNDFVSWLIVIEVALPLFILCLLLIWVLVSGRKKYKEAARRLILKIKNNEDSQKQELMNFLTGKLSIDDAKAKKLSKKIINERKFLFRNLISSLLDKNTEALSGLEDDLTRITSHYHQLEVVAQVAEEPEDEETEKGEDIDELKQEIKSLKHEVHVTLTTLNNIFGEFSSMFGEEVPETEMSVDQIITAMESFSGKTGNTDAASEQEVDIEVEDTLEDEPDAFAEEDLGADEALKEAAPEETAGEDVGWEEIDDPEEGVADVSAEETTSDETPEEEEESLDFSLDSELDDIDSALDGLELGATAEDDEPTWDDAFEESGDKKSDEN